MPLRGATYRCSHFLTSRNLTYLDPELTPSIFYLGLFSNTGNGIVDENSVVVNETTRALAASKLKNDVPVYTAHGPELDELPFSTTSKTFSRVPSLLAANIDSIAPHGHIS